MHTASRVLQVAFVSCTLTSLIFAGPPSIRELRPWGGQRGQTVTFTVAGDQLAAGAEMFSTIPGKLEEQPGGNAGQMVFKLEVRPDSPVGVYPIRLRTPKGLSNVLLFSVGDLPEIAETEPNDALPAMNQGVAASSAAAATLPLVSMPATVNGSAAGTDQDVFRFAGKKGDRVVLEVESQRIGSMLDPAIHLVSAAGRELALADDTPGLGIDCRLDVTLPEDGEYFAVVHDSKYAGGNPGYYRMKIGSFAYAETTFPLGAQRGREADVTLFGGTLAGPLKTRVMASAAAGQSRMFMSPPVAGPQARLPFQFVLGDAPELIEPDSDATDGRLFKDAAVMNGRIAKPGEIDRYKFPVTVGQTLIFEVDAANLGSPLDAILTVTGPQGNGLASADDGNGLDPRLQFTVPGGIDHVVLAVEDLHRRGGPMFAYRLKAITPRTDFSLQVLPSGSQPPPGAPAATQAGPPALNIPRGGLTVAQINVVRSGYNGPIQLTIPETATGITAEDGLIPAGTNTGLLVLSAAADAPLRAFDLEINGQGGAATQPMVRPAATAGRNPMAMADAFVARVPAAITEAPPAKFTVADRSIKILHGHNRQLKITVERGPSATEAINVNSTGLPLFSVGGATGMIAKESNELTLTLTQNPELPVLGTFPMQLTATTQASGQQESIQLPLVKVEVVRPFSLELLNQNATMTVGSKQRIAALVRREAPFDSVVKVGPAGSLPQGVSLTMVEIPKGESLALLELAIGDNATPAEFDLLIRASTDMEGRKRDKDYVIPDISLKVKVAPKTAQ